MPVSTEPRRLKVHAMIDGLGFGGAEVLLTYLAEASPRNGMTLSVSCLDPGGMGAAADRLREHGVEVVVVPVGSLWRLHRVLAVRRHLARLRPDVVHTHLMYADVFGGLAARSLRIPSVSTLHVIRWGDTGKEKLRSLFAAAVRRITAQRVIAVSDAQRQAYLSHGWDRPARVVTVHNGVPVSTPARSREDIRAELGISIGAPIVAMVTVLRAGKGHDIAAEAVARLRERFADLVLVVVGDGPDRARVAGLMAPLGVNARMVGHRDDIPDVLAAADVLLHPSSFDAFPTALLEGLAAGTPVAATAVGGIPEIVVDGETGRLFPAPPTVDDVTQVLAELLGDPDGRRRLGARGREVFTARFTIDACLLRLLEVYGAARYDGASMASPRPRTRRA